MTEYNNITEGVFRFLKCRCGYCGKISKEYNNNFCSMKCKILYFKKMNEIHIGTWTSKKRQRKRHIYDLSELLNEEILKQIIEETEKNIDLRMNKSRR